MGYELVYHFAERNEEGTYDKDDIKTKSVKVGSPYEDVSLEIVAGKIIAQLARRNIFVTDVEIYEFARKKLSFKEATDGILIKNKKFKFDDGATLMVADSTEVTPEDDKSDAVQQLAALLEANPELKEVIGGVKKEAPKRTDLVADPKSNPLAGKAPIRWETFQPADRALAKMAKAARLPFTRGKKYPIYEEKVSATDQLGVLYLTIDDKGNKQRITYRLFDQIPEKLEYENQMVGGSPTGDGGDLSWDGVIDDDTPALR